MSNPGKPSTALPLLKAASTSSWTANNVTLAPVKVPGMAAVVDSANWWDAVNARYIPQKSGWYLVTIGAWVNSGAIPSGNEGVIVAGINGVAQHEVADYFFGNTTHQWVMSASGLLHMNGSTDYLELLENLGVSPGAGTQFSWLSAVLLG